jgi:hypothetical protein
LDADEREALWLEEHLERERRGERFPARRIDSECALRSANPEWHNPHGGGGSNRMNWKPEISQSPARRINEMDEPRYEVLQRVRGDNDGWWWLEETNGDGGEFERNSPLFRSAAEVEAWVGGRDYGHASEAGDHAEMRRLKEEAEARVARWSKKAERDEQETLTVAQLAERLRPLKGEAKVMLHLTGPEGWVAEGVLPDLGREFGVGNDVLGVVYLYGRATSRYMEKEEENDEQ